MAVTPLAGPRAETEDIPLVVWRSMSGMSLAAAGANVIMQLSLLPVGRGVAESRVESGRVDLHPLKRLRTTVSYLVVALLGDGPQRAAMRREVGRAHRQVRSRPTDPVAYDAFDPDLQLWVAACLYRGVADVRAALYGEPDDETADILYRHSARLATTLQVPADRWPPDRSAFARYWDEQVARIEVDEVTKPHLRGVARASFLGPPWSWIVGPIMGFVTTGFLPPPFRELLDLEWDDARQSRFDRIVRCAAALNGVLPGPVRRFPLNAYWWDAQRRIRQGQPIV